jgi:hypothetical protein
VLDEEHVGDIEGAFGTIQYGDTGARRSWKAKLLTLAAIVGPGLIVMVGDNDAGGVATYAQAGQDFGTHLLWVLILLIPVLYVAQEMVALTKWVPVDALPPSKKPRGIPSAEVHAPNVCLEK